MPEEHRYSALSLKTLVGVLVVFLLIAGAAGGWYWWTLQREIPTQTQSQITVGTDFWNQGSMQEARAAFQTARLHATDPSEQARLDMYIAATYANQDPQRTVDSYLAIITNTDYPRDVQSFAGALLLTYVQNTSDESLTSYVFSRQPFAGLYRNDSPSALINREVAYSRAHHVLVSTYGPNFLSYITAGSIYVYLYPQVDASVQAIMAPRIPQYYSRGRELLNDAIAKRSAHSSINALALRTLATFAEGYEQLGAQGLLATGAPDTATVAGEYRRALDYAFAPSNNVEAVVKFTTTLRYAAFMQRPPASISAEDREILSGYAVALAQDPAVGRLMRQSGESTIQIGPFHAYRTALIALAESNARLKEILEEKGWDAADFADQ